MTYLPETGSLDVVSHYGKTSRDFYITKKNIILITTDFFLNSPQPTLQASTKAQIGIKYFNLNLDKNSTSAIIFVMVISTDILIGAYYVDYECFKFMHLYLLEQKLVTNHQGLTQQSSLKVSLITHEGQKFFLRVSPHRCTIPR
jgi:hypothetical protein